MEHMMDIFAHYGLWFVFCNVLLTQLGVLVFALPMIVVAGALAQQGQWHPALVVGVSVVACLVGDLPWYYAGRGYGYRVLNLLCRMAIQPDSCVRQTEDVFSRWGPPSLMFAKFIPGFSTVAPPIAGALRLPLAQFLGYSAIGAALWAGVALAVGMIFQTEVERVLRWAADFGERAVVVAAALVILYIAVRWVQRYMFLRFMRMMRIDVEQLHELMQARPGPVILDARSAMARRLEPRRIPGALIVDTADPVLHAGITPDRDVVIYCT